mmetsp:Transcript_39256/g.59901  ORF Transcript_39256/g.59901 Transcript_39256/m.59901 type:complete len:80 (-) Transcript_39256:1564-1803(-)
MQTTNNKSLIPGYLLEKPSQGMKQGGSIYQSGPFSKKGISPNNIMMQPSLLAGQRKKNSEIFKTNRDIYHLKMVEPSMK